MGWGLVGRSQGKCEKKFNLNGGKKYDFLDDQIWKRHRIVHSMELQIIFFKSHFSIYIGIMIHGLIITI